jgi:hypothetical protein
MQISQANDQARKQFNHQKTLAISATKQHRPGVASGKRNLL